MPWARLDDKFHSHPTTWQVGLESNGLFARALSYCAEHLTDGFLPEEWVWSHVPGTVRNRDPRGIAGRLVETGLWERIEGGFMIVEYLVYNPSRAQVEAEREAQRELSEKGGKARWEGLSPEERTAQARKTAMARWAKRGAA